MRLGVVIPTFGDYWGDPGRVREAITAAEELGFHTAWFGDHVLSPSYATELSPPRWFDPLACALVGAGLTTRIRFATDVLVLPYRPPVQLSQLLASADQLCGGRLTLGVGVGYVSGEFAALGVPPYERRGAVTDEYLRVLHRLWSTDGEVSFDGEWVHFDGVHTGPEPLQRPFPVWVGGNASPALRRAALLGTGWHPLFPTPEQYRASRQRIVALRADAGLDDGFDWSMSCPPCRVVSSPDEPVPVLPRPSSVPAEYHYAPPSPRAADGRARFNGTIEQVAADVRAYADAGVEHLALRLWSGEPDIDLGDWLRQLERWSRVAHML